MAAVKIVLRKEIKKDGTSPLAIRLTKDRKSSYIYLGYSIPQKDWNADRQQVKKSYPNSVRLNNYLIKRLADATSDTLEVETNKKGASVTSLRRKIKPTGGSDFFGQSSVYLDRLRTTGRYNQYTADKPRVGHFREFLKGQNMAFSDITPALLERFKVYLAHRDNPLSERSIMNHLVVIRSIFSQAIKEGLTDKRFYPFGADKIRIKFPESNKIGLSVEEVRALEKVKLPAGSFQRHACNLWLISFYAAGMRASDVLRLRWSDIQDDRLHYIMGKNAKGGSLKLAEKAVAILEQYKASKAKRDDLIFPDLKVIEDMQDKFLVQRKIAFTVSRIDKFLRTYVAPEAKIEKKLTMHIARHTFGNISGDRIPVQMLQKLYRHSSITTTIGYQASFIHKDADEALEAVIGL